MKEKFIKEYQNIKLKAPNSKFQTLTSNHKGITLIALVVTIIVLLILAGVTINIVLSEGGLLKRAKDTTEEQEMAAIKDYIELAQAELIIETATPSNNYNRSETATKSLAMQIIEASIGNEIFRYCENLTSVIIPDSVTNIGTAVFMECDNLQSVVVGKGIKNIEGATFRLCPNLTSVIFEGNIETIGDAAFQDCRKLSSIIIPSSVTSIGEHSFYDCKNLKNIYYRGTIEQWESIQKGDYWDYSTPGYTITYNYTD